MKYQLKTVYFCLLLQKQEELTAFEHKIHSYEEAQKAALREEKMFHNLKSRGENPDVEKHHTLREKAKDLGRMVSCLDSIRVFFPSFFLFFPCEFCTGSNVSGVTGTSHIGFTVLSETSSNKQTNRQTN